MAARPSLNALRAFEAAARLGSFAKAAGELSLTPTAISHGIAKLEASLGLSLFDREPNGVRLTPAGERLAAAAAGAFTTIDAALGELAEEARTVTLSVTPAFAALWLAPRLSGLIRDVPSADVRIEAAKAKTDPATARHVDIAIRYAAAADAEKLAEERFMAFKAAGALNPAANLQNIGLFRSSFTASSSAAPSWADWGGAAGLANMPETEVVFEEEHHAVSCAVSGQGLVLASSVLASHFVSAGLLEPFMPETHLQGLSYFAVGRPQRLAERPVAQVLAWLREHMAADPM